MTLTVEMMLLSLTQLGHKLVAADSNLRSSFGIGARHRIGRRTQSYEEWRAIRERRPRRPYDRTNSRGLEGEEETEDSVPVTTGIGTHFAYVSVGSPVPQRQTVILDTGSPHTAFPCNPCTSCGNYKDYHESGPFEPLNSTTYVATGGNWQASYSEGDGWNAHVAQDYFYLGGTTLVNTLGAEDSSMTYQFGCMYQIGGLFVTQWADGIMGMCMSAETITPKLFSAGLISHKSFSMCLSGSMVGDDGGNLNLGGAAVDRWETGNEYATGMQHSYLKQYGGMFWGVTMKDLLVNGATIGVATSSYGTSGSFIVDSGTTYTYLPTALQANFKAQFKAYTGFDYDTSKSLTQMKPGADITDLPDLTFVLEQKGGGSVYVLVKPSGYFDNWYGTYYPSLWFANGNRIIGANFMRGHDVYFNWQDNYIGWANASCEWGDGPPPPTSAPPSTAPSPLPSQPPPSAPPTVPPTLLPSGLPTREPSFVPTPWQSSSPSAADTVRVAVYFNLRAAAGPSTSQVAALKSTVASWLGVDVTSLVHFSATTALVDSSTTITSHEAPHATQAAAPSMLRRLSAVTWAVRFELSESLKASGTISASEFATATALDLSDPAFEASVSAALNDPTMAVDATSIAAMVQTRSPTFLPSPEPTAAPTNATLMPSTVEGDSNSTGLAAAGTVAIFISTLVVLSVLVKYLLAWQRKIRARSKFELDDDKESLFQATSPFWFFGSSAASSSSSSSFADAEAEEAQGREEFASRSSSVAASASKAATNMLTVTRHADQILAKAKNRNTKVKGRHQRLQDDEEEDSDDEDEYRGEIYRDNVDESNKSEHGNNSNDEHEHYQDASVEIEMVESTNINACCLNGR